jgi:hypothetical protein
VCKSFIDNQELMFRNKIALSCPVSPTQHPPQCRYYHNVASTACAYSRLARRRSNLAVRSRLANRDIIDAACECLGIEVQTFLRNRRPCMTRAQIAQLHANGFTIGAEE